MKEPKLRILNLDTGIQSTVVLLMSCCGDLPPLDVAVFADTGCEPHVVYQYLEWLEGFAGEHGVLVRRVSVGNIKEDAIRKWVCEFAGLEPCQRIPTGYVQQWIGISWDERHQARMSSEPWRTNWYPLVEREITRWGCIDWLTRYGYPNPLRA
jgi:hypothetical protein